MYVFTQPMNSMWNKVTIFSSLTGLNSEFAFSKTSFYTKVKEPSLPYYSPIAGGRIDAFISFPRILTGCEMQTYPFRIWVIISIFYNDKHYTMSTLKSV